MIPIRQQAEAAMARPTAWPLLIFTTAFAFRMLPMLGADFPLNDGGLFYQMSLDIMRSDYRLPDFTSYNGGDIPFAYPPLGFYVAALVSEIPGVALIDVYRLLPPIVSSVVPVLVFLLLRNLFLDLTVAAAGAFVYAVMPAAFEWQIAGGGMSRTFGLAFLVATLWLATLMYRSRSWKYVWITSTCASLTLLSHIGFAFSLAIAAALLFLYLGRSRWGLTASVVVAVMTLCATSPWWGLILSRHGVAPFKNAMNSSPSSIGDTWEALLLRFGGEPFLTLGAVLGVVGLFLALERGWWLLLGWAIVIPILDTRQGPQMAVIPMAAGAAITLQQLTWGRRPGRSSKPFALLVAYLAFAFAVSAALLPQKKNTLDFVTPEDRVAMARVVAETESDASFLVITGEDVSTSALAEWFPVLSQRRSLTTVQGREWLPDYNQSFAATRAITDCFESNLACVERVAREHDLRYTHLYIVEAHHEVSGTVRRSAWLLEQLRASPDYTLVLEDGSTVWARTP